jgi:hypothetical protein
MKRAYCDIRDKPEYRRDAFVAGLKACGFHVLERQLPAVPPGPDDVLVIWNRYSDREKTADKWERQGGAVLVAENGYCGRDEQGVQYYALSRHGHNGSGTWPEGGPERWARLGIELKPWRAQGEHIVVNLQRGIGSRAMASPASWPQDIAARLKRATKRKVVVRVHNGKPGNDPGVTAEMQALLRNAHACVTWSSSNGVRALLEGTPVFYDAPHWICAPAAKHGIGEIESPLMDDERRQAALERMAWAQWTVGEIASGEPFRYLLSNTRQS